VCVSVFRNYLWIVTYDVYVEWCDLGCKQVGLKSFVVSINYRDYMGLSSKIWALRCLFLYLCSYNLVGSVTSHFLSFGPTALSFPRWRPLPYPWRPARTSALSAQVTRNRGPTPGAPKVNPGRRPWPATTVTTSCPAVPALPYPALTRPQPPALRPRQRRKSRSRWRQAHLYPLPCGHGHDASPGRNGVGRELHPDSERKMMRVVSMTCGVFSQERVAFLKAIVIQP
jgi:hypothetical protein